MSEPIWIICPVINNLGMTLDAIGDFLDQTVPTRVLIINQSGDPELRLALERQAELQASRLFVWSHHPSLPSLSAAWNRALDFVWQSGMDTALVVNNDVRLHPWTIESLRDALEIQAALFVSAVAVTQEQFDAEVNRTVLAVNKGGPDFSCFLISKAGHEKYRFDESFIPAYCEDLDTHRRFMLGGDGDKIFSVNLPYLHFASGSLKAMTPEQRAKKEGAINGSRKYYASKWGGGPNEETFYSPFGEHDVAMAALEHPMIKVGPTTPDLQRYWQSR